MSNTYELKTSLHDLSGNFFQNVFAYSLAEAGTATPFEYADALITTWLTNIGPNYMAMMGSDIILDFVSARRITGGGGPTATQIANIPGTAANPSIASGLAFDIAWQTAAATHRPGHTFLAGMADGAIAGAQWANAFLLDVDAFIGAITGVLALAGALGNATFGVFSRKLAQFNAVLHGVKKPKPTTLNKRSLPVL